MYLFFVSCSLFLISEPKTPFILGPSSHAAIHALLQSIATAARNDTAAIHTMGTTAERLDSKEKMTDWRENHHLQGKFCGQLDYCYTTVQ